MRKNERLIGIRPYQTSTGDWHLEPMCIACQLYDYQCPHGLSINDKIKAAKKLMEETSNA